MDGAGSGELRLTAAGFRGSAAYCCGGLLQRDFGDGWCGLAESGFCEGREGPGGRRRQNDSESMGPPPPRLLRQNDSDSMGHPPRVFSQPVFPSYPSPFNQALEPGGGEPGGGEPGGGGAGVPGRKIPAIRVQRRAARWSRCQVGTPPPPLHRPPLSEFFSESLRVGGRDGGRRPGGLTCWSRTWPAGGEGEEG
jgi:hypothetical protein